MALATPQYLCAGSLREDYCITASGDVRLRQPGGHALYAAVGARLWAEPVGLLARVGSNYPTAWLAQFAERGLDAQGVKVLPEEQDTRAFYAYTALEERVAADPAAQFARVGQPVPSELENYPAEADSPEERTRFGPLSVRPNEIPAAYLSARGAHLAPAEFVVHNTLPAALRRGGVGVITCDPSLRYMQPLFAEEVRQIVYGLDAFLPSEAAARAFFRQPLTDLWDAAEAFSAMGAKSVVVKLGARGQAVYADGRRWQVPAYPAKVRDVTGAGDAYCGGFLVGLVETGDPLEAALRGAVAASMTIEGSGALYALGGTPGLAQARREALRGAIRSI